MKQPYLTSLLYAACFTLFFIFIESGLRNTFSASVRLTTREQEPKLAYKSPLKAIPISCFEDRNTGLKRLLEHWKEAQILFIQDAPSEIISNSTAPLNFAGLKLQPKSKSWLKKFASFSSGYTHLRNQNSTYLRIYKGGNNALRRNMALLGKSRTFYTPGLFNRTVLKDSQCIFTFVRDPIKHFISGYNEFEFRTIPRNKSGCPRCTYHEWPVGSQHRFWAFLHDVLSLNLIGSDGNIKHIYPMSGILHHYPRVDFVGSVEYMAEDWKRLQRECFKTEEAALVEFDDHKGLHDSSSDPFGVYQAAKDVVRGSPIVEQVLRKILYEDYRCFYNGDE